MPDPGRWMNLADGSVLLLLLLVFLLVLSFYELFYLAAAASVPTLAPVELFLAQGGGEVKGAS